MKREVPGPAKRLKEPDPRNAALLRCFQLSYCSGGHESALPQGPERAAKTAGARVHNRDRESPTVICRQLKNQPRIDPTFVVRLKFRVILYSFEQALPISALVLKPKQGPA